MAQKGTNDINDYLNDYENTMQDYQQMGPLWAEMVFGDDFEAMKAIYGRGGKEEYGNNQASSDQDSRSSKRR